MDQTPSADFLQLRPSDAPPRGLATWLAGQLRAAIADGRLPGDAPLPATRALAADLGVSRGVVVEAYQRLADEGLIAARGSAGTRVLPRSPARGGSPGPPSAAIRLPRPWRSAAEIDLSPGVPDLSAFPRPAWLRAERAVLAEAGAAELGYGDPRGTRRLRAELASWLARTRGLRADPADIIIVSGVAQALALLGQVLRSRGVGEIAVEDPGSLGAREMLRYWGLRTVPVPVDGEGLVVGELVRAGTGAVMLTPAHEFPTGVVLGPARRRDLVAWGAAGGLIVEDDYDAEFRYDRAPVPALQASAPDRVAYAGSASKTLAPGMRLGWLVPPRWLHADVLAAKQANDLGNPVLSQLVLATLLGTGELEKHVRIVRKRLRARRDALLAAVRESLPRARVQGVAAGLHLLITFDDPLDDAELADRILRAGVLVHPLSWHRQRQGPPGLVLGYAAHPPDQLREGVSRIARCLHSGENKSRLPGELAASAAHSRASAAVNE